LLGKVIFTKQQVVLLTTLFGELDLNAYFFIKHIMIMKHYPGNNIARKENGTSICHVMQGQESKTCPCDF
jgi:hypothetical protein